MTRTIVESATKTSIIGFDQPFSVIGERINPTGRKILNEELERDDFSRVEADALAQVAAGATILDINSGAVFSNKMAEDPRYADNNFVEPDLMRKLVEVVQAVTDCPLCIDSSVPGALEAGLEAAKGRPLLNSVTGEEERLEVVLPLVKKYNVPVVAISNDDTGISEDPEVRFAVAKKIVERAADFGIPAHDIVVDPLVMPIGAMGTAGLQVFELNRRLRDELGVNTTCGASNISFGLPNRHGINNAFLPMAMATGMTSAIMNPVALPVGPKKLAEKKAEIEAKGIIIPADMDDETFCQVFGLGSTKPRAGKEMEAIRAANFLTNNDDGGAAWIAFNKPAGDAAGGAGGRRGGRRRRG
ncbi:5-methyltetrahydrofolate:corrinoid/iron-sulfur protein co-methyltransferase [Aliiroseovarius sp. xm-m-379]|uniref:methyltetrahydrofolate cobalamin methyltransferase n=1 Tax=unclassified Aliiroseovarius TaxID=2623558 RepID=UPI001568DE52|nr:MULTISPECIES: methyltetrahydrofolate cobalamin methyltransferase [unclassified Aliiroseovarius]NRP11765.1 5-methyltetrahydrofolate:corrinoid/iron-sulfur protein co-methyltransferase [Aliiroseovarius sp. xm-d-517]NRP26324.1 5-methyltetrahydrofolate:corrinoid/iron-sulfur protein co-methyltransferase [Aliiroseovarius sp. xm-m-379]NRP32092.1 5-methyltetrahydrofolate:corrinoid/iron-sulfur protein co-methyltransferase [Aliiroseovarius sp. xm-m-314]NRP35123.1 5-methyltetrahydrofolate:corrinoid/iron